MLSIGRIGAGDGWRYLTDQVATQDAPRAGERLLSYYERTGYPAGVWLGHQAESFGLSGQVNEEAMQSLFGLCCDPRGGGPLGRQMARYRSIEDRVADRLKALAHEPSSEERRRIETEERDKGLRQNVTGFDLTFSAPKSVSVAFALGSESTREAVRAAHEAAWRDAYGYFEKEVAATRLGAGGVAQVDVQGVVGAAFEHWYSRAGDPQLHTHVATSVMVQTADGRWRRLDSRALYRASAAAGERYTAKLMGELSARLGVGWRHRHSGRSDTLLPELAGVDDRLIRAFSTRSRAIEDGLAGLVATYKEKHGYAPNRQVLGRLAQQATLTDRPAGAHRSLAQSLATWRDEAGELLGWRGDRVIARFEQSLRQETAWLRPLRRHKVRRQARRTLARMEDSAATWTEWDLRRAATAQLREARFNPDARAVNRVVKTVLSLPETVAVAPPDPDDTVPEMLRRADGSSAFDRKGEGRLTSTRVLEAEEALRSLASARRLPPVEQARRSISLVGELEDDELVTAQQSSVERLAELRSRLNSASRDLARLRQELRALDTELGQERPGREPAQAPIHDERAHRRLLASRKQLSGSLAAAEGRVRVLRAQVTEVDQALSSIGGELATREADLARVRLHGYLKGLGADQVAAATRLADPSRPVDALIGPAGSGKTATLAAVTRAFVEAGRQVQVLGTTAVAAQGLGEAVGQRYATAHAALARWRKGRDLPSDGDLVLMDEASMATTPLLVDLARVAVSRGATVRLVGDPRQLKAVGAGGGLALVAEATKAPELFGLRRFQEPWEAQATLGLRRGDARALDAYFAHDRVAPALDAVAVQEVFQAWWDHPDDRERSVMVASDNATVRQLNLLARRARIEAGQVTEDGLELGDGTVAGVGDYVTTRRNERLIATGLNPGRDAYVRNHDRWRVAEIGADGSLQVVHLERRYRVQLPASYVARDVELGYSDTGHAVQGRTVERADVLVRPSDTRWYFYVAMSRARAQNTAHVVVEETEEEPHGYHPIRSAREVLEQVLARDEPVSATEWLRAAEAARSDPTLIAERYRTALAEERRQRLGRVLAFHGGEGVLAGEEGWRVLAAAERAEVVGLDAGVVLSEIGTTDIESLITALDRARFSGNDAWGPATRQPLAAGVLPSPGAQVAPDVAAWCTRQAAKLEAWRDQLAQRLAEGDEAPHWAAPMGAPPGHSEPKVAWAKTVAQVELYRVTHHVRDDSLLGPEVPLGTPESFARARAARAATAAREIAVTGDQVSRPPARRPLQPELSGRRSKPPAQRPHPSR